MQSLQKSMFFIQHDIEYKTDVHRHCMQAINPIPAMKMEHTTNLMHAIDVIQDCKYLEKCEYATAG